MLSIISIAMITIDHRSNYLQFVRSTLSLVAYPLQVLASVPSDTTQWVGTHFKSKQVLLHDNDKLEQENLLLKSQLQKFTAIQSENMRLRSLLQSSRKLSDDVLIAETLSVSLAPYQRKIVINKGTNSEVYSGQAIIDAYGVMGQVDQPGFVSSTAILITDPAHAIPILVNRNGLRAVAYGTGAPDRLEIPYLPNNVDIKVGDTLVSSGLGRVFPAGYPVATVKLVVRNHGQSFAQIEAIPLAHLEISQEVLLLQKKMLQKKDLNSQQNLTKVTTTNSPESAEGGLIDDKTEASQNQSTSDTEPRDP